MKVPELLAPAGGMDALLAALAAGADAVYTGMGRLSARAASAGLSRAELERACSLAHGRGARIYVTLNAFVGEEEFDRALALASQARDAGADALIVADVGLARALSGELPEMELHLSTQAGVQSADGVLLAARELGCSRVTVARELSVAEIARVCETGVPVETFCHGAVCICYSGACAFSALRRGRSANRGDCTQPCRAAHALADGDGRVVAGGPEGVGCGGDRLLCPHDLLGIRHVEALARAGVASLKIEGRMKNPDYVHNVVSCYREAVDAVGEGREVDAGVLSRTLELSFNRGFTDAYLAGARQGRALMSFERSGNQGSRVGELVGQRGDDAVVALERPVDAGDLLEIRSTPGEHAAPGAPKRWPQVSCPRDAGAGERLRVHCKRRVEPGSAVHVVRSAKLLAESSEAVDALQDELSSSSATASEFDVMVGGEGPGRSRSSMEQASASSGRLPHARLLDDGQARRLAVTSPGGEAPVEPVTGASCRTIAVCTTPEQARSAFEDPRFDGAAVPACHLCACDAPGAPTRSDPAWEGLLPHLAVILDETAREADEAFMQGLCACAGTVVCRNLGQIDAARTAGVPWEAAAPLSIWNASTARWLAGLGARRIWLPDELSLEELCAIAHGVDGAVPLGVMLKGRPQLMVCEHCVLTAEGPCDGACTACGRRTASVRGGRFLVEDDGARLPVEVDPRGRSRIFDGAPLDRSAFKNELVAAGISSFFVDMSVS